MAHTYLLELHELIASRMTDAASRNTEAVRLTQAAEVSYQKGRLAELEALRAFLETHYDPRLPRRFQEERRRARSGPA